MAAHPTRHLTGQSGWVAARSSVMAMSPLRRRQATCHYCQSTDVARLYLGSVHLDACECGSCGARWDEDAVTGEFRGRATRASVVVPRDEP